MVINFLVLWRSENFLTTWVNDGFFFLWFRFNFILPSTYGFPQVVSSIQVFQLKFRVHLPIRNTCPAHLILLEFITQGLYDREYKLSSLLCSCLRTPVTSRRLDSNDLLSTLSTVILSGDRTTAMYDTGGVQITYFNLEAPSVFFLAFRDSSFGTATGYRVDNRMIGFDSRQDLGIFLFDTVSGPALGPTQPPIQWVPGALSLGVKRKGRKADHSPPSSAEVKEWVELYLHSPNTSSWRGA
jgi:hypothetical protein